MKTFSELRTLINNEIQTHISFEGPETLYNPIKYALSIGGKRIRPVLMLMAHQLFELDIRKSLKAAVGIEIFHNFTLLHDDIMDQAPIRRGRKTIHEKWNNSTAILSGDTMLVQAYHLISSVEDSKITSVLQIFNKTAKEVCEGQRWDMDFETRDNVTIGEYLKMIEYKTSVLLAASLKIGAINGGANKEDADHIYEFGKNLGIAFQLKDDLLDIFGDPDTFGKQIGGDIISNKKTYLYLKSLEIADPDQYNNLIEYFSINDNNEDKVQRVKSIYEQLDVFRETTDLIEKYKLEAFAQLKLVSSDNKESLLNFSKNLMSRDN